MNMDTDVNMDMNMDMDMDTDTDLDMNTNMDMMDNVIDMDDDRIGELGQIYGKKFIKLDRRRIYRWRFQLNT
jgi:hypothetical protein